VRRVGFKQAMKTLDGGRISIGALGLGMPRGLRGGVRYSKIRHTFGIPWRSPGHPSSSWRNMGTEIEAPACSLYRAAGLKDRGLPFAKAASMAKLYSSEVACRVADQAVQILGG